MTALFEDIIFGPIRSRRLGISLGVNLLPTKAKICNFNCIYCECGSNDERHGEASQRRFADPARVTEALAEQLQTMATEGQLPDVITFAGNGEPTLHPQFLEIIESTKSLRDKFAPTAKISLLSNATTLHRPEVVSALESIDNNILKLDSAITETAILINRPTARYKTEEIIAQLASLGSKAIVQTMFLRGEIDGTPIDNTTPREVEAWLAAIRQIKPRSVMIYSIDRDTPCQTIRRVERETLEAIAQQVREMGIECSVA